MNERYKYLLTQPEWKEKKTYILKRDRYKCTECGKSNLKLDVHHIRYIKGRKPWDYPDKNFRTLCRKCHDTVHLLQDSKGVKAEKEEVREIKRIKLSIGTIEVPVPTKSELRKIKKPEAIRPKRTKKPTPIERNLSAFGGLTKKMKKPKEYKKHKFKEMIWGRD